MCMTENLGKLQLRILAGRESKPIVGSVLMVSSKRPYLPKYPLVSFPQSVAPVWAFFMSAVLRTISSTMLVARKNRLGEHKQGDLASKRSDSDFTSDIKVTGYPASNIGDEYLHQVSIGFSNRIT